MPGDPIKVAASSEMCCVFREAIVQDQTGCKPEAVWIPDAFMVSNHFGSSDLWPLASTRHFPPHNFHWVLRVARDYST